MGAVSDGGAVRRGVDADRADRSDGGERNAQAANAIQDRGLHAEGRKTKEAADGRRELGGVSGARRKEGRERSRLSKGEAPLE